LRQASVQKAAPWILWADDPYEAVPLARKPLAVAVPWSPSRAVSDPIFGSTFVETFNQVYLRPPSPMAAAGAALGVTLTQAIQDARSTDRNRILRARSALNIPSVWGALDFRNGEQVQAPTDIVLLHNSTIETIRPDKHGRTLIARSVQPPT
jgi:hypothetical protein